MPPSMRSARAKSESQGCRSIHEDPGFGGSPCGGRGCRRVISAPSPFTAETTPALPSSNAESATP